MKLCLKTKDGKDFFEDIIVRVVELPKCVKGVTVPSNDDCYNIFINACYTQEMQKEILKHELRHVKNYDFNNFESIEIVEERAKGS